PLRGSAPETPAGASPQTPPGTPSLDPGLRGSHRPCDPSLPRVDARHREGRARAANWGRCLVFGGEARDSRTPGGGFARARFARRATHAAHAAHACLTTPSHAARTLSPPPARARFARRATTHHHGACSHPLAHVLASLAAPHQPYESTRPTPPPHLRFARACLPRLRFARARLPRLRFARARLPRLRSRSPPAASLALAPHGFARARLPRLRSRSPPHGFASLVLASRVFASLALAPTPSLRSPSPPARPHPTHPPLAPTPTPTVPSP
ncbi:hypothetical protein HNR73_002419, partial [Phytomonospora endophytica]|nr:hypothetical protein [Phytomonospora endophytica]